MARQRLAGDFPHHNAEDGHYDIAPIKQFAPNPYGLYDMAGKPVGVVPGWAYA